MAAINHAAVGFTADATVVDSGTLAAVPNTQFASTDFVGGNRYLLLWRFMFDSTGGGGQEFEGEWRWDTTGAITKTRTIREEASLTAGQVQLMSGATLITSPVTPENLQYYAGRNANGGTIVMNDFKAVVLDLDDLTENTDWFFAEQDDTVTSTNFGVSGTWVDFASLTQTFDSGDWILFPYIVVDVNNTGSSHNVRLEYSGGGLTAGESNLFAYEGEDTSDSVGYMMVPSIVNLDGSSATFNIEGVLSSSDPTHHKHRYSSIVAINLGVFEEFHSDFTAAEFESSGGTYNEAAAITPFTPATAGDFLVLGGGVGAGNDSANTRVQVGGVDLDQANTADDMRTYDARDSHLFCNIGMDSFSGSTDIDLDFKSSTLGDGILDRTLIAISMELAGGGGSDTNVNVASASFSLTPTTATITLPADAIDVNIGVTAASFNLSTNAATVSYARNVTTGTESLSLATNSATITNLADVIDVNVNVGTQSLTLAPQSASVSFNRNVQVGTQTFTLAPQSASVAFDRNVDVGTVALSLTPLSASVSFNRDVAVDAATFTLETHSASVSGGFVRQVVSIIGITIKQ